MLKKILVLVLSVMLLLPATVLGALGIPSSLEAPTDLTLELRHYDNGAPYFYMTFKIPQSILELERERPGDGGVVVETDQKIDNEPWHSENGDQMATGVVGTEPVYSINCDVEDEGGLLSIDIKAHTYTYRVRFSYWYYDENGDLHDASGQLDENVPVSAFSNVVSLGSGAIKINLDTERLSGASRIETAIAVAKEGWPNGANAVILTRDDNYPDALTGTPLSKKLDAPILFTNTQTLTPETAAEITRLKPGKVVILGGTGAVSAAIEDQLKQSYTAQRIGGADRYETAAKIAAELGFKGKAVIATGEDFHDALVAAPLAAYKGIPMLLTEKDGIPSSSLAALGTIAPTETIVVGKSDAVSDNVLAGLTNAQRFSGSDYYDTATVVAENFGADMSKIFFATGKDFPDALSGSALAAKNNSPIIFVNEPLTASVKAFLAKNKSATKGYRLLGGEGAIPAGVVNEIDQNYK